MAMDTVIAYTDGEQRRLGKDPEPNLNELRGSRRFICSWVWSSDSDGVHELEGI